MHKFLFHPIHDLAQIPWVSEFAWFLSYPVTYFIIFFVMFWALFYTRRKMYSFALVFLTGITAWFVANLLKVFLRVERPFVELGFTPGAPESGFSFPSNHMTVVTALAFAVYFLNKKLGRILLVAAVLIGVSRIVLGVHYPLDIFGGFILGYFVYYLYKRIFERF